MGIDTEITFTLERNPSAEFLMFAKNLINDTFPIVDTNGFYYCTDTKKGAILTSVRYYSEGYERGPFLKIYASCEALDEIFKDYGIKIYYYPDHEDWEQGRMEHRLFDKKKRMETMESFCKRGEAPYRGYDYYKEDYIGRPWNK